MGPIYVLLGTVVGLALLVGVIFLLVKLGVIKASPEALEELRVFREELGYRPAASIATQGTSHYVRLLPSEGELHYVEHQSQSGSTISRATDWFLPRSGGFGLQVATRSLRPALSTGVVSALTGQRRIWTARFGHEIATGDPRLDAQLLVLTDDPARARAALATPAGGTFLDLLARCSVVDLCAEGPRVTFSDPDETNIRSMLDATSLLSTDAVPYLRARNAFHRYVAELLVTTRRLTA
jgi:hypothetical protein